MAGHRKLIKITDLLPSTSSSSCTEDEDPLERSRMKLPPVKRSKHRCSYDPRWTDHLGYATCRTTKMGHLCSAPIVRTMRRMVWISFPCQQFRKDKLLEHQRSKSHTDAVQVEAIAIATRCSGGVRSVMEEQVYLQRQAVKGALKCLYWLAILHGFICYHVFICYN